ncbi:tryptophan 2,3-dioxygenase family protein [Salegentibacter salegens]|uniref:Tryptophan 2,3-dioxygenase apoenzyme n=1 Tax=Salegentibacter salegens TaxID=143223 RepID=A0A1M7M0Z8_9FLAO|nr:tryptophan 2,3-dioxygenase family protein [Salegentibacter salegens]PRX44447.1 tryptophan 2,3-dioxygenase [Salegentibacter salegens]SHM83815.1 Tryptophan 2,3-dioxygenase apoenzyme [Salegentibacter salegens]
MEIKPEIAERIFALEEKFKNSGQDLASYLDGLLYDRYLTYWDYLSIDTLLSLQKTLTHFPDEKIFISYHQITELYFKLIIHEQKQIIEAEAPDANFLIEKYNRLNRYFRILTDSFDVMIKGMEREQFLKFRMSLLPASGFQSAQFRMIEIYSTPLENLVSFKIRDQFSEENRLEDLYENIYWKKGGIDLKTGEKTLTLKQFEKRYTARFLRIASEYKGRTLFHKYQQLPDSVKNNKVLKEALRNFDANVNINWPLMHMGAAYRYLNKDKETIAATGGTNWKEFLPSGFQRISFFPYVWNEEELENWGKEWVNHMFNTQKENC